MASREMSGEEALISREKEGVGGEDRSLEINRPDLPEVAGSVWERRRRRKRRRWRRM